MPSSPGYKRNYRQERVTAIARGETGVGAKSKDNIRHKARRKLQKKLGRKLRPDEHVDHKVKLKSGGTNSIKNLRVRSASSNSSDNGHKPRRKSNG